jgi:hypothetical protein
MCNITPLSSSLVFEGLDKILEAKTPKWQVIIEVR